MKCDMPSCMTVTYIIRYNEDIVIIIWLYNIEKVIEGSRVDNII